MIEVTGKSLPESTTPGPASLGSNQNWYARPSEPTSPKAESSSVSRDPSPSPVSARASQNVCARRVDCLKPRPSAEDPRERRYLGELLCEPADDNGSPFPGRVANELLHERFRELQVEMKRTAGASRRRWYATLGSQLSGLFQAEVIAIDLGLAV